MPQISMHSPVGDLTIFEEEGQIVALEWGWGSDQSSTQLLARTKSALDAYFDGEALPEDLPLAPRGSAYRQSVWQALRAIPAGETRTYQEIARIAGGSARSVGGANAANPIPIIIPCHRVVAAAGLGGYSGLGGLDSKRALLALEQL
jgi:methylated-DNA-[protein]-cysteine S-methyltransferase